MGRWYPLPVLKQGPVLAPSPLIFRIIEGFAALLWLPRAEALAKAGKPHLRDSRQRNADRGKGPAKPTLKEKTHDQNVQRQTR
jgi:hypothetical protein